MHKSAYFLSYIWIMYRYPYINPRSKHSPKGLFDQREKEHGESENNKRVVEERKGIFFLSCLHLIRMKVLQNVLQKFHSVALGAVC